MNKKDVINLLIRIYEESTITEDDFNVIMSMLNHGYAKGYIDKTVSVFLDSSDDYYELIEHLFRICSRMDEKDF